MADVGRVLEWLFGEEGSVATETEMGIVMVASATAVTGVFVISPIVTALSGPFGVTAARAGQLVTAFTAPSIVLVPVMGVLADRVGRKPVLVAGLAIFGAAGAAIAFTTAFPAVLGLRALQGVGYAAAIPIGVALIGDFYEGEREATAQGLRVASIQAISMASPPIAGALVVISWRVPFLLYALAILAAAWAWVALPATVPEGAASLRDYARDLVTSLRRPVMAVILFSFLLRFGITFGFYAYVSVLLADLFSASAVASGLVVSVYGGVSLVASSQAGRLTAGWNGLLVLLAGFVLAGVGMAIMGLATTYPVLVGGVAVLGVGGGVTGPIQKSLVTQLSPPALRAGAVSSAVIFQSVGQTAGPLLMGLLVAGVSPSVVFVAFGVAGGALAVVTLGLAYDRGGAGSAAAGG